MLTRSDFFGKRVMDKAAKKATVLARRDELANHGAIKKIATELGISEKTVGRWLSKPPAPSEPPAYREVPAPPRPRKPTAEEFDALLAAPPTAEEFAPSKLDR
jgi:transposase